MQNIDNLIDRCLQERAPSFVKATQDSISYVSDREVDELTLYSVDVFLDRYLSGDIRRGEVIYADISNSADKRKLDQTLKIYGLKLENEYR